MKTTIDIASNILHRSREIARKEHVTLKELVAEGLMFVIEKHAVNTKKYQVQPVTFKGKGLSPAFEGKSWSEIRDAAYEGRGS